MRITLRYIAFLLEVFKVFTVLDNYAVILAAVQIEFYCKIVKLILSAPNVEQRARLPSEERPHRARR